MLSYIDKIYVTVMLLRYLRYLRYVKITFTLLIWILKDHPYRRSWHARLAPPVLGISQILCLRYTVRFKTPIFAN